MSSIRSNLDHLGKVKERERILPVNSKENYLESKEDTKRVRKKIEKERCHKS